MQNAMFLALLLPCSAAFVARPTAPSVASRRALSPAMSAELETFLSSKAGIATKFMEKVMATCDEEMIGSVANLETLNEAGMLDKVFKPVIAASIAGALGGSAGTSAGAAGSALASAQVPLKEVKRVLMLEGQDTLGPEAALRARYDMFYQQARATNNQWDASSQEWSTSFQFVNAYTGAPSNQGPFDVPPLPAGFGGAQWSPVEGAAATAALAAKSPAPAAKAAPAPAPPSPSPPAPAPAPAAAPAADKLTFTVTLRLRMAT